MHAEPYKGIRFEGGPLDGKLMQVAYHPSEYVVAMISMPEVAMLSEEVEVPDMMWPHDGVYRPDRTVERGPNYFVVGYRYEGFRCPHERPKKKAEDPGPAARRLIEMYEDGEHLDMEDLTPLIRVAKKALGAGR